MSQTLYQQYHQEIVQWDWAGIKEDLLAQLSQPDFCVEEFGQKRTETFIGTVSALTPSGKYYMPWACSNVTEREAYRDEQWWAAFESIAESHGLYVTSGEGDPCDIMVGMVVDL